MTKPIQRTPHVIGLLALIAAAAACNKTTQEEAEKAQRDAIQRAEQAQLEANESISAARRDAEKATNDAARARGEARGELQKDVDAVDRKIAYLKERAVDVKGTAKQSAAAAQTEAEKRRTTLRDDFRKLETETGAAWDSAKAAVDRDITALKAAVDSWESAVTNKPAQ